MSWGSSSHKKIGDDSGQVALHGARFGLRGLPVPRDSGGRRGLTQFARLVCLLHDDPMGFRAGSALVGAEVGRGKSIGTRGGQIWPGSSKIERGEGLIGREDRERREKKMNGLWAFEFFHLDFILFQVS